MIIHYSLNLIFHLRLPNSTSHTFRPFFVTAINKLLFIELQSLAHLKV